MLKSRWKKILIAFTAIGLVGIMAVTGLLITLASNLPKLITVEDYDPLLVSEVYSRDGEKIGEFFRERRILTPYEELPDLLIKSFVAAEDSSFFEHHGINFVAIVRAMIANIKAGRRAQGASTITQQVARSLLLTPEKTYTRKIKEMILAYRMESYLSKQDIIYLYLNQIYLGQGAYGVTMAAKTYFRKELKDLNVEEMAILAGLPQAPSRYSPVYNPERAKKRQRYVLKRMAAEGFITEEQMNTAVNATVKVYKRQDFLEKAPFYLETIRQLLVSELGEKQVLDNGLQIHTALDLPKQLAAQKSTEEGLRALDKRQGFRGPVKNITDPNEVVQFLTKTRSDLLDELTPYRLILPTGENPPDPEVKILPAPKVENDEIFELAEKMKNEGGGENASQESPINFVEAASVNTGSLPSYIKVEDIVDAIVIEVDDEWGLVKVRMAETIGLIDFDTMKWARKPNPDVRFDFDEIKKPSDALKVGDVVQVRVKGKKFFSTSINKKLQKLKIEQKEAYVRPEKLPEFEKWPEVQLEQEPIAQAALVSIDQDTEDLIAMVGGYDFKKSQFNRAIQAARQTGSSFKSIVYASALDRNYTPATAIADAPIVYEEEVNAEEGQMDSESAEKVIRRWKPTNHSKRFGGDILFRNALKRSLNVPTVKVIQDIGVQWVADYARRLGIFSPLNMDYTLSLGSSGVTLYELTKVFSQFGRLGRRVRPRILHSVKSREGDILLEDISLDKRFEQEIAQYNKQFEERRLNYLKTKELAIEEAEIAMAEDQFDEENSKQNTDQLSPEERKEKMIEKALASIPKIFFEDPDQLISPQTAYLITSLLTAAVHERQGTGGAARALGRIVAAKTGSTSGYFDGWFVGYTPQIATGTWVGFDQERTLGRSEVGGRNALPIWLNFMKAAHEGMPTRPFPVPSDIIFANIDNETGTLASANTKNYVRQAFLDGTEPKLSTERGLEQDREDEANFYKEDLTE